MRLSEDEAPLPLFWLSSRKFFFVAWPHRSCLRSPHPAPLLRHGWRFAGLYYILRPSPLSLFVSQGQHSPSRLFPRSLLPFIKWTTSLSTLFHADFVATPFPGSWNPLLFKTHFTQSSNTADAFPRRYFPQPSTIPSYALITLLRLSFVVFFWLVPSNRNPRSFQSPPLGFLPPVPLTIVLLLIRERPVYHVLSVSRFRPPR